MKIEYLLFNLLILSSLLIGKKLYPAAVFPQPKAFLWTSILISLPFIIWDSKVTGVFWDFNSEYTLGWKIFNLPIEELLFFLSVPYACLFLWINIPEKKHLSIRDMVQNTLSQLSKKIYLGASSLLVLVSLLFTFYAKSYTSTVLFLTALTLLLDLGLKIYILTTRKFWVFIWMVFGLLTIFNGYLVNRPIVLYSPSFKTNLSILNIPIEDYLYGFILIAASVIVYEKLMLRSKKVAS